MKELYVICQPDRKIKWSGLYIKNERKKKKKQIKLGLGR